MLFCRNFDQHVFYRAVMNSAIPAKLPRAQGCLASSCVSLYGRQPVKPYSSGQSCGARCASLRRCNASRGIRALASPHGAPLSSPSHVHSARRVSALGAANPAPSPMAGVYGTEVVYPVGAPVRSELSSVFSATARRPEKREKRASATASERPTSMHPARQICADRLPGLVASGLCLGPERCTPDCMHILRLTDNAWSS